MHVHICVHIYIFIYVYILIFLYMYVYLYTSVYIHIHISVHECCEYDPKAARPQLLRIPDPIEEPSSYDLGSLNPWRP